MLSRAGLHTVQVMGVPVADLPSADAVVIALKSRTVPAALAVEMSVAAARALLAAGADQLLFKYCSTFDSTDEGNIGPVTEALLALTAAPLTIACPSYPANGRTVYQGHLFVGSQLLSDSPMKDHPLTPMRDSNLVRVLQRQTTLPVGLLDAATIAKGPAAVRSAFAAAQTAGQHILVTDTLNDSDLMTLGAACADLPLVTGGSGIALGLAANVSHGASSKPDSMAAPAGRSVILAGSCSRATRDQVSAAIAAGMPALALDVASLSSGQQTALQVADWVRSQPETTLVYSSAEPESLARTQSTFGRDAAGALVEHTLSAIAQNLQATGFTRFIVAGGETSGAVVEALGVTMLEIGPEIAPGVPWTRSTGGPDLALALKSGNFGAPDFFLTAWALLETDSRPVPASTYSNTGE
jgi:uncharacterized protein YgbK (DUF1537 family)